MMDCAVNIIKKHTNNEIIFTDKKHSLKFWKTNKEIILDILLTYSENVENSDLLTLLMKDIKFYSTPNAILSVLIGLNDDLEIVKHIVRTFYYIIYNHHEEITGSS